MTAARTAGWLRRWAGAGAGTASSQPSKDQVGESYFLIPLLSLVLSIISSLQGDAVSVVER